jgi:multidrug transporter EmrE-like cation transporter
MARGLDAYARSDRLSLAIGHVAASVCWVHVVRQVPLSVAHPLMAMGFLLVPAASVGAVRRSHIRWPIAGMATIMAGVAPTAILR